MANRPRRPRSDPKTPPPPGGTVDEARSEEATSPDDLAAGTVSDETASEGAASLDAAPVDQAPADSAPDGVTPPDAAAPRAEDAPERTSAGLPPPEDQPSALPPGGDEALAAQAREGEPVPPESDPSEQSPTDEASAAEVFAAEEGFTDGGEPERRRHLGEFEDDETLSAAHPHPVPVSVTNTYGENAHAAPEPAPPPPTSSSFGSLLGAGLAGAVLALLGGTALVYSGLLPVAGQPADTDRYAAVGEVESLSSEVAELRSGVEQLQSAQAAGGTGTSYATATDLNALSDRLAAAEQSLQEADGAESEQAAQALQAAQGAQESAEASRQTAEAAQNAANETAGRLDAFDARFAALEESSRQAGIALSAAGLKAAIDRGGPFMQELETFASASGGGEPVEALREFAAEGVPTEGQLRAEWPRVEADIRSASVQPTTGAAVSDQIFAGLSSLVTVRSTGDEAAEGEGVEARLARMTAAINDGDLERWRSEWGGLDEAAREATTAFADRVEARQQAQTVVDRALGEATSQPGTEG